MSSPQSHFFHLKHTMFEMKAKEIFESQTIRPLFIENSEENVSKTKNITRNLLLGFAC